jgi:3-methyl-2-oxobutanoate hydroxymethyltransferase
MTAAGLSDQPEVPPYGGAAPTTGVRVPATIRIRRLQDMKQRGEKFAVLTSYDVFTAAIFDQAGIEVLLVGDSAANTVYGQPTSLPVTVDELIPLARAVTAGATRPW